MNIIKPYRYYSKEEIRRSAANLRHSVEAKRRRPLKSSHLAEAVADSLDLGVVWESISPDSKGQIAAMIIPTEREIIINKDMSKLQEEGFMQSTLAHEIGHWMLHINHEAVDYFIERPNQETDKLVQPFLCRSITSWQGIEWQAQYFASCLLMPIDKLMQAQQGRDLTNWKHLYAMRDELGVTISNLRNRLESLNWIQLVPNSKQIYLGKAAPSRSKS